MRKLKALVMAALVVALTVPSVTTFAEEVDCRSNLSDKYEPNAVMPKGPYKGQCLSDHARPVVETEESRNQPIWKEYIEIANVSHLGEYYIAKIPVNGIDKIIFQLEYFPAAVPAGHTQTRLMFKKETPVTLTPQDTSRSHEEITVDNLVFSVEATGHIGYKFDIFNGLKNHFATVYRVKTLEGFVKRVIIEKNRKVEQWVLKLEKNEMRKFLVNYINESSQNQYKNMYNTLTVNCTNELVRILDKGVQYKWNEVVGKFVAKAAEFYPNIIRTALIGRGLLPRNKSTDIELLGDDPTITQMLQDLR
jgi:hypothetical protein